MCFPRFCQSFLPPLFKLRPLMLKPSQMARGSAQNRGTSSTSRDKHDARVSSSDRSVAGRDTPGSGSGSGPAPLRSSFSSARSSSTTVGIMSTPSGAAMAGSPTARRVFKRPRMMHTSSSTIMESLSPPPPQSLTVSRPGTSSVGTLSSVGATVEGVGVGRRSCGSGSGSSGSSGSGSGRAASVVRLGRVQLLALVQRLRGMAIAERGRWRAERVAGHFTGAESVAMSSREGVDAVLEELKRAALNGDDTARETLLSSKVCGEKKASGRVWETLRMGITCSTSGIFRRLLLLFVACSLSETIKRALYTTTHTVVGCISRMTPLPS